MSPISRRIFVSHSAAALVLGVGLPALARHEEVSDPVIDFHQHTNYLKRGEADLLAHQRKMGVSLSVLLPAGRPLNYGSTYYGFANGLQADATGNEDCLQMARKYPSEFLFAANEVPDFPGAVDEIERYLKLGARIIGELKFNVECDSTEMQAIYELAAKYEVPVLMHWQHKMYNRGIDRFAGVLEKFPRVKFVAHAQTWWANIDANYKDPNEVYPRGKVLRGGLSDQLLSKYSNLYADLSAPSGLNAILRDEDHMRDFMQRHQDKIVFGSDCPDTDGQNCTGAQILAAVKRLAVNKTVERKILYENARLLLKL